MLDKALAVIKGLIKIAPKLPPVIIGMAESAFKEFRDWLLEVLPAGPEVVEIMTYKDAIQYFISERPDNLDIVKGAMLLDKANANMQLLQVFLNKDNEVVCDSSGTFYGRRVLVKQLDAELLRTFGDKELIIVE